MKIICTVTNDLTYDQRMIRICSSLSEAGYEVLLVGRTRPRSVPLTSRAFQQKRLFCFWERGKKFYLEYNLRLFFFLLFQRVDILCAVDLDTVLPAFAVSRLRRKKLVFDAHEYFTEVPEVVRRPRVQRIWEAVARFTLPRIRFGYTVGPALARLMEARYGLPFEVVRNVPFAKPLSAPRQLHRPAILLYQGVLNEGRGLECLISCMVRLQGAELWLAGEGDLSESLRAQVAQAGVQDKVRFLGYIPPDQLPEITRQATLGFNLLENKGLSYYYSLANKAFDYIQAGLPSVQMDFPEYRALQEEFQVFYLIKDLEINALCELIEAALEDEEAYRQMSGRCLEAARTLHWEREERILLDLYRRVEQPER